MTKPLSNMKEGEMPDDPNNPDGITWDHITDAPNVPDAPDFEAIETPLTADNEQGTPYTGGLVLLTLAAKLSDLNALREAYEDLRAKHNDLVAKLIASGITSG